MIQLENAVNRYNGIILNELKEAKIECWIAGGALRDYFMGVPIKTDYDLFFPDEKNFDKAVKFFNNKKKSKVVWESENGMKVAYKKRKYDLVKKFFKGPQETIDAFDFTVSMFAVDSKKIYVGETTFIDLAKRQLMINKITYPASTMSRAFRYYKKGFSMCLGEMKKIIESIQEMKKETDGEGEDENPPSGDELGRFFIGID